MTTAEVTASPSEGSSLPWWLVLLEGIAILIIGVLLLIAPVRTSALIVWVLGFYWFIGGIFQIVSIFIDSTRWGWKLFVGILGIIAGIIIIQHPLWSTFLVGTTLVIVLGIEGIIIGIARLIQAFQGDGWGAGILGVLSILLGILLLANVWVATAVLPLVLAIFAIIGGIIAIIVAFRLR